MNIEGWLGVPTRVTLMGRVAAEWIAAFTAPPGSRRTMPAAGVAFSGADDQQDADERDERGERENVAHVTMQTRIKGSDSFGHGWPLLRAAMARAGVVLEPRRRPAQCLAHRAPSSLNRIP